jgi:hypothetical protein
VKAVLQTIWRLAAGLAAIHKAGIIHRDIKPANIIVGEGLRVKITDFGVAAKAGTPTSMRLGTTKYMAPELFAGAGIDARVDIYSLGMITYEMLIGRAKFNEIFHDVVRDPHSEALRWMKWHSSPDQVAPPADEANPAVPPALAAIVAKMMAKDPGQRYANVELLGRDIRLGFSPRQKAAAPGRAARRPRGPVGVEAERPAAASMLEMDDDLAAPATAEAAGPATAPIPGRSFKAKLKSVSLGVWVSIAAVLVVFTVGGLVLQQMSKTAEAKRIRVEAEAAYDNAMADYKKGANAKTLADKQKDYQAALDNFTSVMKAYQMKVPGIGKKSYVMGLLSHAYVYVVAHDFDQADQCLKSLNDELRDYERNRPDLMDWVQAVPRQHLRAVQEYRDQQNLFVKYLEEAHAAVDKNDLEAALDVINNKLIKGNVAVSREEEGIIERLQRTIQEMQKQDEFRALIKAGDALAARGDANGAIKKYDQALALLEGSKETLTYEGYTASKHMAEFKKTRLQNQMRYAVKVGDANKPPGTDPQAAAKRLREAAGLYDEMVKAKVPADQLADLRIIGDPVVMRKRADDLEFNFWLEKARTDLAGTRYFQVLEDLKMCEKFRPGSQEAKLIAAAVTANQDYITLVADGHKAFQAGKWEEARTLWQKALAKNPGAKDLPPLLVDCNYKLAVEDGDRCRRKGDYAGAKAAYLQAAGFKPTAKAEMDARIDQMATEQMVNQHMADGKSAVDNKKWAEARRHSLAVLAIQPGNKEAAKLVNVCWYEEFMAQGRDAMKISDYNSAQAYFLQALNKIKNDDPQRAKVAETLAEQAKELRDKSPKEGGAGG